MSTRLLVQTTHRQIFFAKARSKWKKFANIIFLQRNDPLPRTFFSWSQEERQKKSLVFFYSINILCFGQRALQRRIVVWYKEVVIPILKGLCQDPDRVFLGRVSIWAPWSLYDNFKGTRLSINCCVQYILTHTQSHFRSHISPPSRVHELII